MLLLPRTHILWLIKALPLCHPSPRSFLAMFAPGSRVFIVCLVCTVRVVWHLSQEERAKVDVYMLLRARAPSRIEYIFNNIKNITPRAQHAMAKSVIESLGAVWGCCGECAAYKKNVWVAFGINAASTTRSAPRVFFGYMSCGDRENTREMI